MVLVYCKLTKNTLTHYINKSCDLSNSLIWRTQSENGVDSAGSLVECKMFSVADMSDWSQEVEFLI